MFLEMLVGFLLGATIYHLFLDGLFVKEQDEKPFCIQHKWVMDDLSKDLKCSECGREVEELRWSDKDLR